MNELNPNGGDVDRIAEALTRLGERNLTWPALCERAGVDHEIADPLWRALGFPDVPPDEPAYTEEDVRALLSDRDVLARDVGGGACPTIPRFPSEGARRAAAQREGDRSTVA